MKARQVFYGGFIEGPLGGWPQFDPNVLVSATPSPRDFVVKSTNDGMGSGVLAMTDRRWREQGWTVYSAERTATFCHRGCPTLAVSPCVL